MDSITKLRGKLAEAEDILQYVSKELEGYSTKDAEEHLNFAELKLRGEQYSFYEHPLTDKPFRDDYLALMIYLISLGGKKEEGWTVLYRIAAGCDYQGELQNLTTDAMTFTEERLSDLIREIYSAELANIFAIDSLMISHHMGADDAQLKFLAGVYELLKLNKGFLTEAIEFVKVPNTIFWDNLVEKIATWKYLSGKDIITYIDAYHAVSLEEATKLDYKRIVFYNTTYKDKDVIKLDDWKANEILFLNCHFENCGGIHSTKQVVKFAECLFDGNVVRYKPLGDGSSRWGWTDEKYFSYRGFLHFNHVAFGKCTFKNFQDGVPMLYFMNGKIENCIWEHCQQTLGSMLLNINNAVVRDTKFIACQSTLYNFYYHSSYGSPNTSGFGCMIYSYNSLLINNEFTSCINKVNINDSGSPLSCILLMEKSSCKRCNFKNINLSCIYGYHSDKKGAIATIGMVESEEQDNQGISITNVSTIPKEIFIVGNKKHED